MNLINELKELSIYDIGKVKNDFLYAIKPRIEKMTLKAFAKYTGYNYYSLSSILNGSRGGSIEKLIELNYLITKMEQGK